MLWQQCLSDDKIQSAIVLIQDNMPAINLEAGQIVRVRSRQYLVEDVVLGPSAEEDTLVRLSCLDDDALGDPLEVLWEREVDAQYIGATNWDLVASQPRI